MTFVENSGSLWISSTSRGVKSKLLSSGKLKTLYSLKCFSNSIEKSADQSKGFCGFDGSWNLFKRFLIRDFSMSEMSTALNRSINWSTDCMMLKGRSPGGVTVRANGESWVLLSGDANVLLLNSEVGAERSCCWVSILSSMSCVSLSKGKFLSELELALIFRVENCGLLRSSTLSTTLPSFECFPRFPNNLPRFLIFVNRSELVLLTAEFPFCDQRPVKGHRRFKLCAYAVVQ